MAKSTKAQKKASAKYDANHTTQVAIKLNNTTDADILAKLDSVDNKQGYIKMLIRKDMCNNCSWIPCSDRAPEKPCIYTLKNESPYTIKNNGEPTYRITFDSQYLEMYESIVAWMPLPEPYKGN